MTYFLHNELFSNRITIPESACINSHITIKNKNKKNWKNERFFHALFPILNIPLETSPKTKEHNTKSRRNFSPTIRIFSSMRLFQHCIHDARVKRNKKQLNLEINSWMAGYDDASLSSVKHHLLNIITSRVITKL